MSEQRIERLSVLVPFKDESDNLARYPRELLPALNDLGLHWELVLVDDGSGDDSLAVARGLARLCREAQVVVHDVNRGLGAAIRSGIAAATGDVILTLDADLTFHPSLVAALVERYRVGDVDLVLGSPMLAGFEGVPWYRIALSRVANLVYQAALRRRLTAVTPIFRLYRAALLAGLEIESDGFEINAELLAKLLARGARVAEVPATLTSRLHGESKLVTSREIRNHLRLLGRLRRWRAEAQVGVDPPSDAS